MSTNFSDTKVQERPSYNVVFKTLVGTSEGVMTRSSFKSKTDFEQWYGESMRDGTNRPLREVYAVVARGISDADADRMMKSPENTDAIIFSLEREAISYLGKAAQTLASLRHG